MHVRRRRPGLVPAPGRHPLPALVPRRHQSGYAWRACQRHGSVVMHVMDDRLKADDRPMEGGHATTIRQMETGADIGGPYRKDASQGLT